MITENELEWRAVSQGEKQWIKVAQSDSKWNGMRKSEMEGQATATESVNQRALSVDQLSKLWDVINFHLSSLHSTFRVYLKYLK